MFLLIFKGASQLIRKDDIVVLGFDNSPASCAMLNIVLCFQCQIKNDNEQNQRYQKRNRYITKVLFLEFEDERYPYK